MTYGDYIQNKMFNSAIAPFYHRMFPKKNPSMIPMDKNLQKVHMLLVRNLNSICLVAWHCRLTTLLRLCQFVPVFGLDKRWNLEFSQWLAFFKFRIWFARLHVVLVQTYTIAHLVSSIFRWHLVDVLGFVWWDCKWHLMRLLISEFFTVFCHLCGLMWMRDWRLSE